MKLQWICKHGERNAYITSIPISWDAAFDPEKYLGCACGEQTNE